MLKGNQRFVVAMTAPFHNFLYPLIHFFPLITVELLYFVQHRVKQLYTLELFGQTFDHQSSKLRWLET